MTSGRFGGKCLQRYWLMMILGAAVSSSGQSGDTDVALQGKLREMVDARAAAGEGHVSMYAVELSSGKHVRVDADRPVQTASVIKLAILYEAMEEVRAGKAAWDEKVTLRTGEAVAGSGLLTFLDTPVTLTLKDVLTMMVIVSDNTATNLAIDRFGVGAVNARMVALGLGNTHLYKKVMQPPVGPMPADQPKFGLGKTTAREMATLMGYIGECKLHELGAVAEVGAARFRDIDAQDKAVCGVGLGMLKNQFYRETIPRYLESVDTSETGTAIASKTGSLDAVRADVAIVGTKRGPMVISIFTYENKDHGWTVDNEGEVTIARLGKVIVDAWSREGLDGTWLVPGLGLDVKATGAAK